MSNLRLHKANVAKNDEFYTQYNNIDTEMRSYLEYDPNVFKDRVILLPCDDYLFSNFTRWFIDHFNTIGARKIISSCFVKDGNGRVLIKDSNGIQDYLLEGDGDFRSEEVTRLRDEADFVITNPPFSLFRKFLDWVTIANKRFSAIGSINTITYKSVFPLLKDNKLWLGATGGVKVFTTPGGGQKKFGNTLWYTNIKYKSRRKPLVLQSYADNERYNKKKLPKGYQHYDNYNAIDIPYTCCIPADYSDEMGVPISFLNKYCPEQFEIIGSCRTVPCTKIVNGKRQSNSFFINGKEQYNRIIIKHKAKN